MGKRKQSTPVKASEEKQVCLSWNMLDGPVSGSFSSLSVINDNDSSLVEECEEDEELLKSSKKDTQNITESLASFSNELMKDLFHLNLENCLFFLNISKTISVTNGDWFCELGRFQITKVDNSSFPNCLCEAVIRSDTFWLYISKVPDKSMIYFELEENNENDCELPSVIKRTCFWFVKVSAPLSCLDALQNKVFQAVLGPYDNQQIQIIAYATKQFVMKSRHPSEVYRPKKLNSAIQSVMSHFYNILPPDYSGLVYSRKHDLEELYLEVKRQHWNAMDTYRSDFDVQHASLKPLLRPYQRSAVEWMVYKEKRSHKADITQTSDGDLHELYTEIITKDGQTMYYNRYGGSIIMERHGKVRSPPGGILADEMGLGKTVEVLACMLLHPREGLELPDRLPTLDEKEEAVMTADLEFINSCETSCSNSDTIEYSLSSSASTNSIDSADTRDENSLSTEQLQTNDTDLTKRSENSLLPCDPVPQLSGHIMLEGHNMDLDAHTIDNIGMGDGPTSIHENKLLMYNSSSTEPIMSNEHTNIAKYTAVPSESIGYKQNNINISAATTSSRENSSFSTQEVMSHGTLYPNQNEIQLPVCPESNLSNALNSNSLQVSVLASTGLTFTESMTSSSSSVPDLTQHAVSILNFDESDAGKKDIVTPKSSDGQQLSEISKQNGLESIPGVESNVNNIHRQQMEGSGDDSALSSSFDTNMTDTSRMCVSIDNENKSAATAQKLSVDKSFDDCSQQEVNLKTKNGKRRRSTARKGYSQSTKSLGINGKSDFFTDGPVKPKEFFECVCGVKQRKSYGKHCIQCVKCGLWQHAECLNYDLNDAYRGDYKCPHCHVASAPISSGATLIISPFSICHQWVEEITKHIKLESLKVFVYSGVNKQGFIQPRTLAKFDIVITTYETLKKEIDYVDLPHSNSDTGRKFRHPKRFMAIPSPIIAVEWWRICLDEAQMVECTTTKTAEMALRLSAINRWCVTGTPIQKGVEDLYGLLLFLGVDPYWAEMWWRKLVLDPFCYGIKDHMYNLLTQVLWRTAKKDVLEQIDLPEQTKEVHWLTFSPVEDHFYRRQYKDCVRDAMKKLSRWTDNNTKLNSLDRHTLSQLLYPLLKLRQACCHPQAVRGEFLPIHQSTMTMEELLVSLTKKAKQECEESHRQLVAALNGMAGLHIINNEYCEAVDLYREVLRSVNEHEELLRTDDLQLLHALSNLDEVLTSKPEGVLPTLRDDQLKIQAKELKEKYMSKVRANTENTQEQLQPITAKLRELTIEFQSGSEWWIEILQEIADRDIDEPLVEKIKEDLTEKKAPGMISIANRFRDITGLEYILHGSLLSLQSSHQKLLKAIKGLSCKLTMEVINKTVECCLRPEKEELKTCPFCKAHELFEEYESKLFSFTDKGITSLEGQDEPQYQVNTKRQGTWADSEMEKTLKCILSFSKQHRVNSGLIKYGACHISIFETLKKEFKHLRLVWMALREQVSAIDELNMATTRLRLRLPDEPTPEVPQPNVLEPVEFDHHKLKLLSERTIARNELKKKLGQLLYLKNLAKSQEEMSDGCNPEPCPICHKELGIEWSVLLCGHCFCLDCMKTMVDLYSFGGRKKSVKCAICRQPTQHGEISYVSTKPNQDDSNNIKGSHSTKVSGVVKCLLKILKAEPDAKALIFSTWTDVLDVISHACRENNISHRYLQPGKKFQENLSSFKQCTEVNILLLPVHSGANGLNLIEATHVILVEPLLNPAQELQAIGRVHRIGQTRPTQVHHFLIRGTIEQKIHNLMEEIHTTSDGKDIDENPLTIGDLSTLFTENSEGVENEEESFISEAVPMSDTSVNRIDGNRNDGQYVRDEQTAGTSSVPFTSEVPDLEQWSFSASKRSNPVSPRPSTSTQEILSQPSVNNESLSNVYSEQSSESAQNISHQTMLTNTLPETNAELRSIDDRNIDDVSQNLTDTALNISAPGQSISSETNDASEVHFSHGVNNSILPQDSTNTILDISSSEQISSSSARSIHQNAHSLMQTNDSNITTFVPETSDISYQGQMTAPPENLSHEEVNSVHQEGYSDTLQDEDVNDIRSEQTSVVSEDTGEVTGEQLTDTPTGLNLQEPILTVETYTDEQITVCQEVTFSECDMEQVSSSPPSIN